ncbi:DUF3991 and toprim domain-containing protein [Oscillibacter sp.]|uniref:DUF3991 and toprim domain-containing protein n=1 Tax=Oscillibacter sp. TaxID=1945593 RepID=UPI0028B234B4|nr:DUF3991 and toprim domain-containing protein [Oscillibacter sp.]
MGKFIYFTAEQKQNANDVDLVEFLLRRGERLLPSGREKRLVRNHSITVRGNAWFDHATEQGGHAISFVCQFYQMSYPDAVTLLLNGERGQPYPSKSLKPKPPPKPFHLPPANGDMRRVFSYLLNVRGLSRDTVAFFAHQHLLYEDVPYHNAVFVGRDVDGVARHAHRHSTGNRRPSFHQTVEGSDGHFPLHWVGQSGRLYVFEAPIDLLSFIDLRPDDWQSHSYVACCGTSSLPVLKLLELAPQIQQVFLCMDNDKTGNLASERITGLLAGRCAAAQRLSPVLKDWNEDLIAMRSNGEF